MALLPTACIRRPQESHCTWHHHVSHAAGLCAGRRVAGLARYYPGLVGGSNGVERRLDWGAKLCPGVVAVGRGISGVIIRVGEVTDEHGKLGGPAQQMSEASMGATVWAGQH